MTKMNNCKEKLVVAMKAMQKLNEVTWDRMECEVVLNSLRQTTSTMPNSLRHTINDGHQF